MKNNQRNLLPKNTIIANERIEAREVRFTNADGESVVMPLTDALQAAYKDNLDLILINAKAQPPLCKIMEINKYLYEQKQKEKEREELVEIVMMCVGCLFAVSGMAALIFALGRYMEKW